MAGAKDSGVGWIGKDARFVHIYGCWTKNRGVELPPKMDGLFHGSNPIFQWMIWVVFPLFLETPIDKYMKKNMAYSHCIFLHLWPLVGFFMAESNISSVLVSHLVQKKECTLQGTNRSHMGKKKIIFKSALVRDMLIPRRVIVSTLLHWQGFHVF